jgi:hypothetical protein
MDTHGSHSSGEEAAVTQHLYKGATMATARKCLCGCGGAVNPGRSFRHGHNTKKGVTLKSSVTSSALRVKTKIKRAKGELRRSPISGVIHILRARQKKLKLLIQELREL